MYKVVIGDGDEGCEDLVTEISRRYNLHLDILGTSASGRRIHELADRFKPDILLISVDLTGMSGLEVIRLLRETNQDMRFVLFSGYEYYGFIKQGMESGISDYLMKPLNEQTLAPVLRALVKQLDQSAARRLQEELENRKFQNLMELSEQSFIYATLLNSKYDLTLKKYHELLELGEAGCMINIESGGGWPEQETDITLFYQIIKNACSGYGACAVGPIMGQRIVCYIGMSIERSEKTDWSHTKASADRLALMVYEKLGLKLSIGVGGIKRKEDIHDSYEEAVRCLRYQTDGQVIHIQEVEENAVNPDEYYVLENSLLDGIRFGRENSIDIFTKILDSLGNMTLDELKNRIIEILVLACHKAEIEQQSESDVSYMSYFRELNNLSFVETKSWAYRKFEYLIRAIQIGRGARKSVTVKEALKYIGERFTEDLSLDEVSEYVGVTPQHFSKLFKEETGNNYMEYLTRLRIDAAKDHLKDGEMTVKEIGYLVGYHDPNYFSRVFKKTVGISPTEFVSSDLVIEESL